MRGAAQTLAAEIRIVYTPLGTLFQQARTSTTSSAPTTPRSASTTLSGNLIEHSADAADLGPANLGLSTFGGDRVATAEVRDGDGAPTGYVQYGRSLAHVDSTVDRLWLFIAAGVFGGTLLASLAGLAIAGRAMRPVSSLTASAREIAETGDPSRHMPEPKIDDEVGELARDPRADAALARRRPRPSARRR